MLLDFESSLVCEVDVDDDDDDEVEDEKGFHGCILFPCPNLSFLASGLMWAAATISLSEQHSDVINQ